MIVLQFFIFSVYIYGILQISINLTAYMILNIHNQIQTLQTITAMTGNTQGAFH